MTPRVRSSEQGFGLVSVLMLVGFLFAAATALAVRVRLDTRGAASFHTDALNLAIAEAGVNIGVARFRNIFLNGNTPTSSDYAVQSTSLVGSQIRYQLAQSGPRQTIYIPLGTVPFGGLFTTRYNYTVTSATPDLTNPFSQVRGLFQVDNIPVFQFLAFYDGDLEILPGQNMVLNGRIHTNASLYLNSTAGVSLTIADAPASSITTVDVSVSDPNPTANTTAVYRGRLDDGTCTGTVIIDKLQDTVAPSGDLDPQTLACSGGTSAVTTASVATWLGAISAPVSNIGLPTGFGTGKRTGGTCSVVVGGNDQCQYWDNADVRIGLDLTQTCTQTYPGSATTYSLYQIVVLTQSGSVDSAKTTLLRTFMNGNRGAIFYTDVPCTASGGNAAACTQCPSGTPGAGPTAACSSANVANSQEYRPNFAGPTYVYRRADQNQPSGSLDAGWVGGSGASNDKLGNPSGSPVGTSSCGGVALGDYRRGGFYNNRENKWVYLLNVDVQRLLTWDRGQASASRIVDADNNTSNGGTVMYLTVVGASSNALPNNYGVRVMDTPNLGFALNVSDPLGLTIVSDQAMYVQGNYNSTSSTAGTGPAPSNIPWNHAPASLVGDTMNVLSAAWDRPLTDSTNGTTYNNDQKSTRVVDSGARTALASTLYTAFIAGVDVTNAGSGCCTGYNGGFENYPRFHEHWTGQQLTYRGSFVSLQWPPRHQSGRWCGTGAGSCNIYNAPNRQFNYDPQFNDIEMLPPMTPTFVAVRQLIMSQDFR